MWDRVRETRHCGSEQQRKPMRPVPFERTMGCTTEHRVPFGSSESDPPRTLHSALIPALAHSSTHSAALPARSKIPDAVLQSAKEPTDDSAQPAVLQSSLHASTRYTFPYGYSLMPALEHAAYQLL